MQCPGTSPTFQRLLLCIQLRFNRTIWRLWGRMMKWMTHSSHPEATLVNARKAFITRYIARPERATEQHDNSDENPHAGSEAMPFNHMPTTCPPPSAGHTYKLQLPAFMLNTASTPITLFDFHGLKRFGRGQHKDRVHHRAEFHLLYCNYPGLCKTCDFSGTTLCTCLNYSELRTRFLQDSGKRVPNKAQMPAALDARRIWGQHAGLTLPQQELCPGPERSVHVFDQAIVGNATLACIRVEKSKFARDSVVLTKSNGKSWAGRVNAMLSHAPPGWEDWSPSEEANVAEANWYAYAVCDEYCHNTP